MKLQMIMTTFAFLMLPCALPAEEGLKPQKDPNEAIAVSWSFLDIKGTTLCMNVHKNYQRKSGWSEEHFSIGYRRENEQDSMKFIPVLSLPPIVNDSYVAAYSKDRLRVSRKSDGREIVNLNLEAVSPTAITGQRTQNNTEMATPGKPSD